MAFYHKSKTMKRKKTNKRTKKHNSKKIIKGGGNNNNPPTKNFFESPISFRKRTEEYWKNIEKQYDALRNKILPDDLTPDEKRLLPSYSINPIDNNYMTLDEYNTRLDDTKKKIMANRDDQNFLNSLTDDKRKAELKKRQNAHTHFMTQIMAGPGFYS